VEELGRQKEEELKTELKQLSRLEGLGEHRAMMVPLSDVGPPFGQREGGKDQVEISGRHGSLGGRGKTEGCMVVGADRVNRAQITRIRIIFGYF